MYTNRPDSSIATPLTVGPLATPQKQTPRLPIQVSPVSDPAIFGAYEGPFNEPLGRNRSISSTSIASDQVPRKSSTRKVSDSEALKTPLPPLPPSFNTRRPTLASRDLVRAVDPLDERRGTPSTERNIVERRRLIASKVNEAPGAQRSLANRKSPPLRRRGGSASSQMEPFPSLRRSESANSQKLEASRSSPTPRAPSRVSTARNASQSSMVTTTMTSGIRNQGMSSRLGSDVDPPKKENSRTNSNLYREIDEILRPAKSGSGTISTSKIANASPSQDQGPRDRRPLPLKMEEPSSSLSRRDNNSTPLRIDPGSSKGGSRRRGNRDSGERRI